MKVLVLTAFYPNPKGSHERMFVHVRNKYYVKCGIDVTVLNFDADSGYVMDGVTVISLSEFVNSAEKDRYDIAICHSANIRNHYLFMKRYGKLFPHYIFFFHGHEILYMNKDYPKPYDFLGTAKKYKILARNLYDGMKIHLWASFYKKMAYKSDYVFVSHWIMKHFFKNTGLGKNDLLGRCHIINNGIGKVFEENSYDMAEPKEFDFITIRSNIDGSKYCVDLLVRIAEMNPELLFLLIGKGQYFEYNKLPLNLRWINKTLGHEEMLEYMNKSKCGLMLTREDTQGVMTCEMAAYGIPVITSDIEVCHEFFDNTSGVRLISNEHIDIDIARISESLWKEMPYNKNKSCWSIRTIQKEVELIYSSGPR